MTKKLLRISGFSVLACLFIYLSSCVPTEITLNGNLNGTVTDNENNEPIQNALVELSTGDQSALTDSTGYYQIRNIDPVDHTARASANDYFSDEEYVVIREAETKSLDFSLERSGRVIFSLDSLEFGFESDSLVFNLSNTGKEQMNYAFELSAPWISIDPIGGFLDVSDSVAVTVSIDRTGQNFSTREESIQINTANGDDVLDIYVNRVMDMDTNFYRVVEIGEQIWMAENLNVGTRIDLRPPYADDEDLVELLFEMVHNGIIDKSCYENSEYNCSTYGGLYQWHEAMQWWGGRGEPGPPGPTQGICPDGWHIPTMNDWNILVSEYGGMENAGPKLTEGSSNCINDDPYPNESGFSAKFGGWLDILVDWKHMGLATFFWSDESLVDGVTTFFIGCRLNNSVIDLRSRGIGRGAAAGLHVRCIKDP